MVLLFEALKVLLLTLDLFLERRDNLPDPVFIRLQSWNDFLDGVLYEHSPDQAKTFSTWLTCQRLVERRQYQCVLLCFLFELANLCGERLQFILEAGISLFYFCLEIIRSSDGSSTPFVPSSESCGALAFDLVDDI